jgi:hypothetical protein
MGFFGFQRGWQSTDPNRRLAAVSKIQSQKILARLTFDPDDKVRTFALAKIRDQSVLVEIAKFGAHDDVRIGALKKISDPCIVDDIVVKEKYRPGSKFGILGVTSVSDPKLLVDRILWINKTFGEDKIFYAGCEETAHYKAIKQATLGHLLESAKLNAVDLQQLLPLAFDYHISDEIMTVLGDSRNGVELVIQAIRQISQSTNGYVVYRGVARELFSKAARILKTLPGEPALLGLIEVFEGAPDRACVPEHGMQRLKINLKEHFLNADLSYLSENALRRLISLQDWYEEYSYQDDSGYYKNLESLDDLRGKALQILRKTYGAESI